MNLKSGEDEMNQSDDLINYQNLILKSFNFVDLFQNQYFFNFN